MIKFDFLNFVKKVSDLEGLIMYSDPVLGDLNRQFLEVGFGGEGKDKNVDAAQF